MVVRIARPTFLSGRLPARACASVAVAPGVLAVAVAPSRREPSWRRYRVRLAGDDVRVGIANTNLRAPSAVSFALKGLWNEAGLQKRRVESVSLIVPDQVVRLAAVPLDGREPGFAEGEAMARWALRDLVPLQPEACRIDWAALSNETSPGAHDWLLAIAAAAEVVREYERVVEGFGLPVGRVVPMSLALAAGAPRALPAEPATARLVLCEVGGLIAGLIEADGVPRFHRAWRRPPADLEAELRMIDRYLQQRLGLTIAEATVAGGKRWREGAIRACEQLGWHASSASRWAAHRGASR